MTTLGIARGPGRTGEAQPMITCSNSVRARPVTAARGGFAQLIRTDIKVQVGLRAPFKGSCRWQQRRNALRILHDARSLATMPDDGYEIRPPCRLHKVRPCVHVPNASQRFRRTRGSGGTDLQHGAIFPLASMEFCCAVSPSAHARILAGADFAADAGKVSDHGKFKVNAPWRYLTAFYRSFISGISVSIRSLRILPDPMRLPTAGTPGQVPDPEKLFEDAHLGAVFNRLATTSVRFG